MNTCAFVGVLIKLQNARCNDKDRNFCVYEGLLIDFSCGGVLPFKLLRV